MKHLIHYLLLHACNRCGVLIFYLHYLLLFGSRSLVGQRVQQQGSGRTRATIQDMSVIEAKNINIKRDPPPHPYPDDEEPRGAIQYSNKRRNQSRSFCDILMLYELFALFRPFTVRTAIFGQQLDYPCPVFCFSVQAIGSDDGGRPLPPKGPEAACTFGECPDGQ